MFWIGLRQEPDLDTDGDGALIMSYNMASKYFEVVPRPALGQDSLYHLMAYENKIAIFDHDRGPNVFNLWVMEEPIGTSTWGESTWERRSWTKIFSISCPAVGFLVPVIFWGVELVYNSTELVYSSIGLVERVNLVMSLLNTTTNEIKVLATRGCGDGDPGIFNYSESLVPVRERSELIWLCWETPQQGWCKLNIGGIASSQRHSKLNIDGIASSKGYSGCGGVIRGDEGEWLSGFSQRLPNCSSQTATLWAMCIGIKLCWNMGFKKIEVECDDEELVQVINSKQSLRRMAGGFSMIFRMLTWEWQVSINHIYRETNRCADRLAWLDWGEGMNIWDVPPPELLGILQEDLSGIRYPRRILVKPFYWARLEVR